MWNRRAFVASALLLGAGMVAAGQLSRWRSEQTIVAAEPDPKANVEENQALLTIYYPQNGPAVPEAKKYDVGSFTVVNMNDTDGQQVVLTIVKGNIKLWEDENKAAASNVTPQGTLTLPVAQLPKTVWIECCETDVTKLELRGIELKLDVGNVSDSVRATAVWAKRSHFWNTAKVNPNPPPPKLLNGDETNTKLLATFANCFDSDLDMGTFHGPPPTYLVGIGGREETEFTICPPDVGKETDVVVDCSRQGSWRDYAVINGDVRSQGTRDFFTQGWNRFEIATDDNMAPPNPISEDTAPKKDHVYKIDGPAREAASDCHFQVARESFREFVRFKFGPDLRGNPQGFVKPNFSVDGARGSDFEPWHFLLYVKRAQKATGQAGTYTWDNDAISTSFAIPDANNTGNGGCVSTPDATNGVTEGWTVTYVNGNDTWTVAGTGQSAGTLTKQQDGTWTGKASKNGNDRITITVTSGTTAFTDGDCFRFSTFRTGDVKKNEIETDEINITAGP